MFVPDEYLDREGRDCTVQLLNSVQPLLRKMRWSAGLTQQELADRSGLSIRTISDIERGHVLRPRVATLRLLARALEMSDDQTREFLLTAYDSYGI